MSELLFFKGEKCAPCNHLKEWMDSKGIEYVEKNMIDDLAEFKMNGVMRVPVVIKLDESGSEVGRVMGFDIKKMEELINA